MIFSAKVTVYQSTQFGPMPKKTLTLHPRLFCGNSWLFTNFLVPPATSNSFINHAHTRYFKLKPEVQKLFPDFADIDPAKLPTNYVFITQTDTYAADLNSYIEQLGQNPTKCPFVAERRAKHYDADLKVNFDIIFLYNFSTIVYDICIMFYFVTVIIM